MERLRKRINSNQQILPILVVDQNLLLLLATASAIPLVPLFDVARVFGENPFRLGNLGGRIAIGIIASPKKDLDLATAMQFLAEPSLPFVLNHFLFDTVHDAQSYQEVVSVHPEALSSLQETLGCALSDCVAWVRRAQGERELGVSHAVLVKGTKACARVPIVGPDGRVGNSFVDVSDVDSLAHD